MDAASIFVIVLASITIGLLAFIIVYEVIRHRYKLFVNNHSVAFRTFLEIKKKYSFYDVSDIELDNSYDNENYYNMISPEDYLIYTLAYEGEEILKACALAKKNRCAFRALENEVKESVCLGVYDADAKIRFPKLLKRVERSVIQEAYPRPTLNIQINVTLYRTNIVDQYLDHKSDTFSERDILDYNKRVRLKRGTYFCDSEIFQALCRVERGKVTNKLRFAIYARDGSRCKNCGSTGSRTNPLEIDHIIPISKGGKSVPSNLQTLCHVCNYAKGNRIE